MLVVVGGGYAGCLAAVRAARQGVETVLVDPGEGPIDRVRLHEMAAGRAIPQWKFADLLAGLPARHVRAEVRSVGESAVVTDAGEIPFDRLIVATGSGKPGNGVPGMAEHAVFPGTVRGAAAVAARMPAIAAKGGRIAVVGAGQTGTEVATELAERWPAVKVVNVDAEPIGAFFHPTGAEHVRRVYERLRIEAVRGRVEAVLPEGLVLAGGGRVAADLVIWCGAFVAGALPGLVAGSDGRVAVDPWLRIRENTWVVGDAARIELGGRPLRMSCATAMPEAAYAADAAVRSLRGLASDPFSFRFFTRCTSLGRADGLVEMLDADGLPTRAFTGAAAKWVKAMIVRYPLNSIRAERLGIAYRWPHRKNPPALEVHA